MRAIRFRINRLRDFHQGENQVNKVVVRVFPEQRAADPTIKVQRNFTGYGCNPRIATLHNGLVGIGK